MLKRILVLLIFGALACEDLLPIESRDLCKGENPPQDCKCDGNAGACARGLDASQKDGGSDAGGTYDASGASGASGTSGMRGTGGTGGTGGASASHGDAGGNSGNGGSDAGGAAGHVSTDANTSSACSSCPADAGRCLDGSCVQCVADGDCQSDAPKCDPATHACVECL